MMRRRSGSVMALALLVAGCGGGDGGAPAPAPTPTPSPSPTFSYSQANSFAQDHRWTGYDAFYAPPDPSGTNAGATLTSSTTAITSWSRDRYGLTMPRSDFFAADTVFARDVGAAESSSKSNIIDFRMNVNGVPTTASLVSPELWITRYFAVAQASDSQREIFTIAGDVTYSADLARFSTRTYQALLYFGDTFLYRDRLKPLVVDLVSRKVSGTVALIGNPDIDVTVTGTVDSANTVTGTFTSADGSVTGQLRGRFYGPGGKDLGLVAAVTRNGITTRSVLSGTIPD